MSWKCFFRGCVWGAPWFEDWVGGPLIIKRCERCGAVRVEAA